MAALTNEQLEILVEKRNAAGAKNTVEVMNNEELAAYRFNCIEAIERQNNRLAKAKKGGTMEKIHLELIEQLEGFIKYIDEKLNEEQQQPNGEAVIDEFLSIWKQKAFDYYMDLRREFKEEESKKRGITAEGLKMIPANAWGGRKYSDEQINEIMGRLDQMPGYKKENLSDWIDYHSFNAWKAAHSKAELQLVSNMRFGEEAYLNGVLDGEVERKRVRFIAKVESKAGKIIDGSGLYIADNLDINGQIVGEKATVTVKTIYAGGYNVQCLHYRVLVK